MNRCSSRPQMVQLAREPIRSRAYHRGPVYSQDSVKERKRMKGVKCPVSPGYFGLMTRNRGTAAGRFEV